MAHESLANQDWRNIIDRLGGEASLEASARETKAFERRREFRSAVDMLRVVLAYCLGSDGLRLTAAWAMAIGLVDISNPALLFRLRKCGGWLTLLIGHLLEVRTPQMARGRRIRIIDGTTVPKKGGAGSHNKLWRIHSAFDLPEERFGHFELTDESEGETLDRIPAAAGDILLADRGYLQAGRMAGVLAAGADFIIRAGWKSASWQGADGEAFDLITALAVSSSGIIDQPVWLKPRTGPALALRLVAVRKPLIEAEKARAKARRASQRGGHAFSGATLVAADWVILITSLAAPSFTAADVLGLYRLRWRVELGFKRLKSVVGLAGPPGADPRSARPYILAHLLMILLLEPLVDELGDSPRLAPAS